ncbi:MAG: N-acetylmuramic acid 6-phosphate etherase [Coprobacillus sp.]
MKVNINQLDTEKINLKTINIDNADALEIARLFNDEDKQVAYAVEKQLDQIAQVIDIAAQTIQNDGRIVYIGAGNSGRLAAGDACECIPTFGVEENVVIYILAGGPNALIKADEKAEDSLEQGIEDLKQANLTSKDLVIGLSASGRTPYTKAGLDYAKSIGCQTVSIACSHNAIISQNTDICIEILVGQEAITGSTRLKAGTAQKMVLNIISSGAMIKLGKVYKNYMVDVSVKNAKLFERGKKIIKEVTNVSDETAEFYLNESHGKVKNAIVMINKSISYEESVKLLKENAHIGKIIQSV